MTAPAPGLIPPPSVAPPGSTVPGPPIGITGASGALPPPPPPLVGYGTPPPPPPGFAYAPPVAANPYPSMTAAEVYAEASARKNRVAYVLLGLFLGGLGVHNFYAGYPRRAAAQLATTFFSWMLFSNGYGTLIVWIWAIVEICVISKDSDGVQFV